MKKIDLYGKENKFSISNLLNTDKISEIEFILGIDDRISNLEIEEYFIKLEKEHKLLYNYTTYIEHKNYTLFYFVDTIGNKKYLCIENNYEI